jgi:uncharacterized membrane protein
VSWGRRRAAGARYFPVDEDGSGVPVVALTRQAAFRLGIRPVTNLVDTANVYSLVVVVLAGVVGIVSLIHARTSTLLGVFISVTIIPAASDIAVASVFGSWDEARSSLLQLLLNVVVLIVVGWLPLRFVRLLWRRIPDRRRRDDM